MSELGKWFEKNKVPDFAIVDKENKIVQGFDYDNDQIYSSYSNIDQILKELEAIGVYTGDIDGFPDFDDIAGREELKKVVMASVINGKQWLDKSISNVKGVFLYGSPGGGKTYFVKAAAKELAKHKGKDNVVYLDVSNIESPYIGETATRIKRMTEKVKQLRKAGKDVVLVMDEVDRLAPNRALDRGSGAKRDTTNSLLTAINELQNEGVHIFAMTNDPNMVDKALQDRMSVRQYVSSPSYEEFKVFFDKNILDSNIKSAIDINTLARSLSDNNCSFRDAISLLNLMNVEMKFGKSPSEASREALMGVLHGKKDQDKTFLGPNT